MSITRADGDREKATKGSSRDSGSSGSAASPAGPSHAYRPAWELALFLYAPFLITILLTFAFTADDPFITLRYAANLVHGHGLVFNRGQFVQGFTSPLHIVVAAVSYVLPGEDYLFKLKMASFIFGLLALREASILIYWIEIPRWLRRTALLAVGTSWIFSYASGNGLETTLVVWLLVALVRRIVIGGPETSILLSMTLAFALVLTRLDSLAPLVCMAIVGLLVENSTAIWRRIVWFGGAAAGLVVVALGGLLYYGSALPNTYYAKDMALRQAFSYGIDYLVNPIRGAQSLALPNAISAFVLIVELGFFVMGLIAIQKRFRRCWYLVAIVIGQAIYIVKSGGDWMPGGRFLAITVIPLVIVDVLGLLATASYLRKVVTGPASRAVAPLGALAIVVASFLPLISVRAPVWSLQSVTDAGLLSTAPSPSFIPRIEIRENLPQELSCLHSGQLIATSEIGYLGFVRLDLPILDIRGLTDRTIANQAPSSTKFPWGVKESNLFSARSVVGRAILHDSPVVIATFDGVSRRGKPPELILNGRYHLVKAPHFGRFTLTYYSMDRDLDACLKRR